MAFDLKSATPDTTFAVATAYLFGADTQSASDPSIFDATDVADAIKNYILGLANTWTTTQTITPATEVSPLVLTGGTLAGTTSRPLIDATQTWNNSGLTATGIKLNVTDTSSNAASLLMDLQVGGTSRFRIGKGPSLVLQTDGVNDFVQISSAGTISGNTNAVGTHYQLVRSDSSLRLTSAGYLGFNSTATLSSGAIDAGVGRNGAGIIEINSGTGGTLRDLKARRYIAPMTGELTIATGAITVTGSYHNVDTEADGASDDLDTINGGTDGAKLVLRANHTDRTVVVKDGTGNLQIAGDMTLDNTQDTITLIFDNTLSAWLELGRAASGA